MQRIAAIRALVQQPYMEMRPRTVRLANGGGSFWRSDCPSSLTDMGKARTASGWFENSTGEGGAWRRCGNSNSLEHSHSREDNGSSTSQEIFCILHIRKFITVFTTPCHRSLKRATSIQSTISHINFNITFPSRVPTTIRAPYRTHLIFPDPFTLIVFGA
jgi:hypothetical protein